MYIVLIRTQKSECQANHVFNTVNRMHTNKNTICRQIWTCLEKSLDPHQCQPGFGYINDATNHHSVEALLNNVHNIFRS